MASLSELIETKRTLVCVGPGGVGKTTTSATLALLGALQGRRTLVLTVDPAHRLANSLGLDRFEEEEQRIDVPSSIVGKDDVHFYAMMLNTKKTFDGIVNKYAPSTEARDRILNSPYYVQAATHLAGSQEYMAMEKLYEIHTSGRFDLIILDTPPTAHALDFLDAPNRLEDFMNTSTEGLLAKSSQTLGRFGLSFLKANAMIVKGVSKFLGTEVFMDILNFLDDFKEMYSGFKQRAAKVKELMRSRQVGFVILAGPERASLNEGLFFHRQLTSENMSPSAFVLNRVRQTSVPITDQFAHKFADDFRASSAKESADADVIDEVAREVATAARQFTTLAEKDAEEMQRLKRMVGKSIPTIFVPDFSEDLHDLGDLHHYAQHLIQS